MKNFITDIIDEDIKKNGYQVYTRFPPEPNGYLHIGHCTAVYIDFEIARQYGGKCNLRLDDTNPDKEDIEYVNAIKRDIEWFGYKWDKELYASDYYDQLYDWAVLLIKKGLAYVDFQSPDEITAQRGTLTEAGKNSPYRDTSIDENLKLFQDMKDGKYEDGKAVLRAKIDMANPNINFRDPVLYRIKRAHHHRTGDKWCIYPMYDFAHGQSDYIEGITHSICTLEFEIHRPLYNWFLEHIDTNHYHPRQIEFARVNLTYILTSKRKLLRLVTDGFVDGWDDPRMPTISGLKRRGYTAKGLMGFVSSIEINKNNGCFEYEMLEYYIREDLNKVARRSMAVLNPLKLTITNYDGSGEMLDFNQGVSAENPDMIKIPFSKNLYVEKDDYMDNPDKKWFRLAIGKEVRLMNAYYITVTDVKRDEKGEVCEVLATYDSNSKGGWSNDGRKVKGTIHWIDANTCQKAELHVYNKLFKMPRPDLEYKDIPDLINPDSKIVKEVLIQKDMDTSQGIHYQFLRKGYYIRDSKYTDRLVFNQTVELKEGYKPPKTE